MFFTAGFARNVEMLRRSMGVSVLRGEVIANNIANSDTPNFKRSVVNFESALKSALASEKVRPFPALMTDERHIAFQRPLDWREVRPSVVWDYLTTSKNNGNNVDIEQESMDELHNQMMYTTMAQAVSNAFAQVNIVLR
jgi:flagellar basal-body rod protein FlgB